MNFGGIESRIEKVIKKMEAEGRVTTLSLKDSQRIDDNIAKEFLKIKKEFERKHNASIAHVRDMESGRINLKKKKWLFF